MSDFQFRVLYRQFLFRMVDLELLSVHAQGDVTKMFGQFASLLIFINIIPAGSAFGVGHRGVPHAAALIGAWRSEHFLIAATMLAVGLFAVLSWDSTFLDRRDVMVLAPLPVPARTLFFAKVAALGTALGLTVMAVNALSGLTWPVALAPSDAGYFAFGIGVVRSFTAYWVTMFASGAFIFCSVLVVQGAASYLLPRRIFLRLSAALQLAAFCLFVSVFFLEPSLGTPATVGAALYLPSYWFLGLLQMLNGSMHPVLVPLAHRAITGLSAVVLICSGTFVLSYLRTLRKIVEEPDISPGARGARWLPHMGNQMQTAIVLFSVRTLLRSRQHRVMLCFYLGVAFAVVVALLKTPVSRKQLSGLSGGVWGAEVNAPLIAASIILLVLWIAGARIVFSLPLELRANWAFRVAPICGGRDILAASRRALIMLSVAPVLAISAAIFLWLWPPAPAVGHLAILGIVGLIVVDLCLFGFHKIPFGCSYLPGKSNVHMVFWGFFAMIFQIIAEGTALEVSALKSVRPYAAALSILVIAAVLARWWSVSSIDEELQFEDVPSGEIQLLGLHRDGHVPMPGQGMADRTAA